MVTAFHGLNAYSGKASVFGCLTKARQIEALPESAQVCCSDVPVGSIGVLLTGEVHTVYSEDAFTCVYKDGTGERFAERQHVPTYSTWLRRDKAPFTAEEIDGMEKTGAYREILMQKASVDAVWYTKESQAKRARVIARQLGTVAIKLSRKSNFMKWQTTPEEQEVAK